MKFQSINELEHFDFKDTVLKDFSVSEDTITLQLEAVIVKPENTQNGNYTYSYAADTTMVLSGARISCAVKEGYKYYDANDVLREEVPDTPLDDEELAALLKGFSADGRGNEEEQSPVYMWNMTAVEKDQNDTGHFLYLMGIDVDEDTTYWLQIEFDRSMLGWDRYMNRVEQM